MKCKLCDEKAVYNLYRTVAGEKKWVNVCSKCEELVARENKARQEGKLSTRHYLRGHVHLTSLS